MKLVERFFDLFPIIRLRGLAFFEWFTAIFTGNFPGFIFAVRCHTLAVWTFDLVRRSGLYG